MCEKTSINVESNVLQANRREFPTMRITISLLKEPPNGKSVHTKNMLKTRID